MREDKDAFELKASSSVLANANDELAANTRHAIKIKRMGIATAVTACIPVFARPAWRMTYDMSMFVWVSQWRGQCDRCSAVVSGEESSVRLPRTSSQGKIKADGLQDAKTTDRLEQKQNDESNKIY